MAPLYYRGASVILIVYDVTERETFTRGVKDWIKELNEKGLDKAQLVLVGNKQDLAASSREVSEEEAGQYALTIGAAFYEASAKTGYNVDAIFGDVAGRLEKSYLKNFRLEKKSQDTISFEKDRKDSLNHKIIKKCCHT